jgi:hypothetical protein
MLYATLDDAWNRPTNFTVAANKYKSVGATTLFNRFKSPEDDTLIPELVLVDEQDPETEEEQTENIEMFNGNGNDREEEFLMQLILFVMMLILLD